MTDLTTVVAALGAGVAGGSLFAFSAFVMRALGRLPDDRAAAAMQAINREAPTPAFMLVLFGTAALTVVTGIDGARHLDEAAGRAKLVGSLLYLASAAITVVVNVPLNDRLEAAGTGPDAAQAWRDFVGPWTAANHVRAGLAVAGAAALTLAHGWRDGD